MQGADAEEHALHGATGEPRAEDAEGDSDKEEPGAEAKELREDLLRQRAERHAHPDLAAALAHGVGEHAVGADGGEQKRDGGKDAGEDRRRAPRDKAVVDSRLHGAQVVDRQFGVDLKDGLLHHRSHGCRREGGAHEQRERVGVVYRVREVDGAMARVFGEFVLLHAGDDPDDRGGGLVFDLDVLLEPVTQRISPGPVVSGESLIDDADALLPVFVGVFEQTAFEERDPHHGPIVACDGGDVMRPD